MSTERVVINTVTIVAAISFLVGIVWSLVLTASSVAVSLVGAGFVLGAATVWTRACLRVYNWLTGSTK